MRRHISKHFLECLRPEIIAAPRAGLSYPQWLSKRKLSSTPTSQDESDQQSNSMARLSQALSQNRDSRLDSLSPFVDSSRVSSIGGLGSMFADETESEPHHLHVFATRHNTHITLTTPERNPLISLSAGNIGFRHSGRKHYDSAFQLAGYIMGRIQEQGLLPKIKQLEFCLRGFGPGREAVTKALLGNEGKFLRNKVVKVSDATRLKFGGTRSRKPRRLG